MCKRLRDILFPTNIFGKKRQSIEFSIADIPSEGTPGNAHRNITIVWSGERMVETHTIYKATGSGYSYEPVKNVYTDGDSTSISLTLPNVKRGIKHLVQGDVMYFDCTNVTYLSVNGTQLI